MSCWKKKKTKLEKRGSSIILSYSESIFTTVNLLQCFAEKIFFIAEVG
jgi:hypothetical protein